MKFGILGGTFNPIHNGHITVALKVCEVLKLDKVFLMPNKIPPHKNVDEILSEESRLHMVKLCTQEFDVLEVEEYELGRDKISYTYESLEYLNNIYKGNELFFIIGSDSFINFYKWKKIDKIFKNANIVVYLREKSDEEYLTEVKKHYEKIYNAKIFLFTFKNTIGISSTKIRDKVLKGEDISNLVPKCVNEYIIFKNLYKR